MVLKRSVRPALFLTGTLITCGLFAGCAQAFKTSATGNDDFPTERLLAMAEAFETQGDFERANTLHEAIRLRDPSASWLTRDEATPKSQSTGLNEKILAGTHTALPPQTAFLEQSVPDAEAEKIGLNILPAESSTPDLQPGARDTENLLATHPPFDQQELLLLEATESTDDLSISLAVGPSSGDSRPTNVDIPVLEIPVFDEELFASPDDSATLTDAAQMAVGEFEPEETSFADQSVPNAEFSGKETLFASSESGLRSSQPEVVTALHEVELTPSANAGSRIDMVVTPQPNKMQTTNDTRRARMQPVGAGEFVLPVIQR